MLVRLASTLAVTLALAAPSHAAAPPPPNAGFDYQIGDYALRPG